MKFATTLRFGFVACFFVGTILAGEPLRHAFERKQLTDIYFSEGANAGDVNRDGRPDIVCGPYWFAGPEFTQKHEIYPPKPQPRHFYADNFFNWIHDFNGDGWSDMLVVGFPGTPAHVYENSGSKGGHWRKHVVFDAVANESPHFTQLVGDDAPELVCTFGGQFGFATFDPKSPFAKWTFHPVSPKNAPERFGHGLGVGDVNGDGRLDILQAQGWFEQPARNALSARWNFHPASFTPNYGGAEMYAYDVDGDGDNDVITSLAAHDFGLAWFEQDRSGHVPVFRQHQIMGKTEKQNRYGVLFTEPHSVALVDIDGDGLKDIVTGKTYWSHHDKSPLWNTGAVVYWFKLTRGPQGVDWIPHRADGESGIGRQITARDLNGDQLPDIVVGGMKGAHLLLHRATPGTAETPRPAAKWWFPLRRGPASPLDTTTGSVPGVLEAEKAVFTTTKSEAKIQSMEKFTTDRWSGNSQLLWMPRQDAARLSFDFDVPKDGDYELRAVFTMARDYPVVQPFLDDTLLGTPLNLYNFPQVLTTGVQKLGKRTLKQGKHQLSFQVVGGDAARDITTFVGIDYVQCVPLP